MNVKNSIIVPAYNEEKRSGKFIPFLLDFIKKHIPKTEIIIVNDGSTDSTAAVVNAHIKRLNAQKFAKVIGYSKNKGKGNAVAFGVKAAKGEKILFIDADGSISPEEIPCLLKKLNEYEVVCGDRTSARSKIKTTVFRKITSFGFNFAVAVLFGYGMRDNLCGFKGFKKSVAKEIFSDLKDRRWVFDVELLYKIKKKKYSLHFMPIAWKYVGNSRIKMFIDPIKWFFRLISLRWQIRNYR
ncbi:glycosyltransferase [Candidatus Woesearchaeota archaeon]|nr:glycosyltransferase [Candidatus Woesearchaeota archaeon]